MSPTFLFTIVLLLGLGFVWLGRKMKDSSKKILLILGIVCTLFGGYGVFTAML